MDGDRGQTPTQLVATRHRLFGITESLVLFARGRVGRVSVTRRVGDGDRDLAAAMSLIQANSTVVTSQGCGVPTTLLRGLALRSHQIPVRLMCGLHIDGYPFMDSVHPKNFRLLTWHINGPLRTRLGDGAVEYVASQSSAVPALLVRHRATVTLLRVSPADAHGFHCLGPSVSYPLASARHTPVVIAEVDPEVPRTFGSWIHESRLTAIVDAQSPMPEYRASKPDEASTRIAALVAELIPERPVLQLGIGSIPEALMSGLLDRDLGPLRFCGMATDAMVDVAEAGRLDVEALYPQPAILAAELMGGPRLMRFASENPLVGVCESAVSHDADSLGELDRFVSIISALEVDLSGQVNSETLNGRQIAGVGGSRDYVRAARSSRGGISVVAMPATSADGRHSRVVPTIAPQNSVTLPRGSVDLVVTEYGVADLRGCSDEQRRELLINIAAPPFRDQLALRGASGTYRDY